MSDLRRCVKPLPSVYRVVAETPQGTTLECADSLESAKSVVEAIGGRIECYVYGWGWVRWCEAMKGKGMR
jgi:hypothetical protein